MWALIAPIVLLIIVSLGFKRVVVEGRSMLPAYSPGQRLVVNRFAYLLRPPREGDVVVVCRGRRLDLKRVTAVPGDRVILQGADRVLGPDEWFVTGDNPGESTDSRHYGPVRGRDILGKVWFAYKAS